MHPTIIVVIAPEGSADALEQLLKEKGVEGYTSWPVKGWGAHGHRPNQWATGNFRLEALVPTELAKPLLEAVREKFPRRLGVIAYAMATLSM
jgi:nitrogen regulatory protein PII